MADFTGNVGGISMSFGESDSGSIVNSRIPSGTVKETKLSAILTKTLDSIDIDLPWLAYTYCTQNGTVMQNRMFDFCVAFLRHWASRYDRGEIKNSQVLYPHCAKASAMVRALDQDQTTRYIG